MIYLWREGHILKYFHTVLNATNHNTAGGFRFCFIVLVNIRGASRTWEQNLSVCLALTHTKVLLSCLSSVTQRLFCHGNSPSDYSASAIMIVEPHPQKDEKTRDKTTKQKDRLQV